MTRVAGPGSADTNVSWALLGLGALAALVSLAAGGYRFGFEVIHDAGYYFSGTFLQLISSFGETLPAIALLALLSKRNPRVLWMAVLASLYAAVFTHLLKNLFDSDRPPAVFGDWVVLGGEALKLHSFTSGHTVTAFVLAACFSVGSPRSAKIIFYSFAVSVGLSRVCLGVHWPVDVFGGVAVAGLSVYLALQTLRFSAWGLGLAAHCLFVCLIAACALVQLLIVPEHPAPLFVLRVAIGATSLSVLVRDYIMGPVSTFALACNVAESSPR